MRGELGWVLGFTILVTLLPSAVQSDCREGCDIALASYDFGEMTNLTFISQMLGNVDIDNILNYNPQLPSRDFILTYTRVNAPFRCDCLQPAKILGHEFRYAVQSGDTYDLIATRYYANLTTRQWLQRFSSAGANRISGTSTLNVVVNCSCGDPAVSDAYGLFVTYPLRSGESLRSIATESNLSENLLRPYNPNTNFSSGRGLVYIPGKDKTNSYPPLARSSSSKNASVSKAADSTGLGTGASPGLAGFTVDKSVEFSYEELAKATNDFSLSNKIGEGGFGSVYYAELRGEKAAIKKMDMQASKEFLAEIKVLTNVHHLNLVHLIGYCVEDYLFVVYEYIDNGNLNQHLRGSGRDPLPWSSRVQIALDSARGLKYIHEHTAPLYIHRDVKSANILVDKNFHGKVADFGLTKLTEVANASRRTRLVGTFGYIPPEYAQYGDVSPKVDVFAFGVVLYELISAKEAIVRTTSGGDDSKGLVALFQCIFSQPDPKDDLCKVVDPKLGDDYPIESVWKVAQLARACTLEDPTKRPAMRSVVVALMTLSSNMEEWGS